MVKNLVPLVALLLFAAALAGFAYYMGTQAKTEAVLEDVNPTAAGEEPNPLTCYTHHRLKVPKSQPKSSRTSIGLDSPATTVTDDDKRNQSQQSLNPDEAKETKIDIPPGKGSQEPQTEQVEFDIKGAPESGSKQTTSPDSQ
ncbi:MAG: hypothetical protein IPJ49_16445 [Candidatus Obscuribacter sp.]|nr:hypothetical protein [Candidatus Obscuribacter sp.]